MVQKDVVKEPKPKRARGRPRAYDVDEALARARDAFWESGYSGTTLDELSAATSMNRPSLYGAFGDKHALYLATLHRYVAQSVQTMDETLATMLPLRETLLRIYDLALSLYFRPGGAPKGCFLVGTAAVEAVNDDEIRDILRQALLAFDRAFEARFTRAREAGEIDAHADPATLAKLASAILHTLALRSRAGDKRPSLRATAEAGVAMICGTCPPPAPGRKGKRS